MVGRDTAPKEPSQRQLRVGEEIRRVLTGVFDRGLLHDPALLDARLTISEVTVSPDLRNATVWITPLGGGDATAALAALKRSAGRIGGMVARDVKLRFAPRLKFERDTAFDVSNRINALLRDPAVQRDLEPPVESETPDEAPDEVRGDRDGAA